MQIDPASLDPRRSYRLLISAVVPRPIALVTSLGPGGVVNLAPFSFFQGVSASPPVVSLAVGRRRDGSPKDTWRNIETRREFVVHAVTEDLVDAMMVAAAEWPPEESEVQRAGLALLPGEAVAVPRLAAARVAMECVLHAIHPVHQSALILGEVVRFHLDDAVVASGGGPEVDYAALAPVARLGGNGYVRSGQRFERRRLRPEECR